MRLSRLLGRSIEIIKFNVLSADVWGVLVQSEGL